MAAAQQRPQQQSLADYIAGMDTAHLLCRVYRHRFVDPTSPKANVKWEPPAENEQQGHWALLLACERCAVNKYHAIAPDTGYVELELSRYTDYPEGYLTPDWAEWTLNSREARGLMRLELLRRKHVRKGGVRKLSVAPVQFRGV